MENKRERLGHPSSESFRTQDDIDISQTDLSKAPLIKQDESCDTVTNKMKNTIGLKLFSTYKGLLFTILASLLFSIVYAIVKFLKTVNSAKVLWVNSVFMTVYSNPTLIFKNVHPFGSPLTRRIILIRSVVYALIVYMRYSALHYIPVAEASVIIFSYPIMVSVFGRIVLKEPFGLLQATSAVLTVVGVVLVSKLPLEFQKTKELRNITLSDRVYGVAIAFSSTILTAFNIICTRSIKHTPVSVILFNNGWAGVFVTLIIIFLEGELPVIPCGEPSLLIVFCSILEILGTALLYKGLQIEQAGITSVVQAASQITFLFCWQLFFFKETPDMWSISGVIIVIFCAILSTLGKYMSLCLDDPKRKMLL
ncbi:solute carrier family 35 member G1-like [Tachypleus tridentatus]|uniref:solute carrier family 35 member G1-like n=1 Tax=Tachypleus tridentatus TaxID=6853 RepID=UPI003FCF0291